MVYSETEEDYGSQGDCTAFYVAYQWWVWWWPASGCAGAARADMIGRSYIIYKWCIIDQRDCIGVVFWGLGGIIPCIWGMVADLVI